MTSWERISSLHDRIIDAKRDADADFKARRIDAHEWSVRHARLDARCNRLAKLA